MAYLENKRAAGVSRLCSVVHLFRCCVMMTAMLTGYNVSMHVLQQPMLWTHAHKPQAIYHCQRIACLRVTAAHGQLTSGYNVVVL